MLLHLSSTERWPLLHPLLLLLLLGHPSPLLLQLLLPPLLRRLYVECLRQMWQPPLHDSSGQLPRRVGVHHC
jgi:hypothetical protein